MHSSLAVTTEGLPLGLGSVKIWTRKRFKGCNALKHKVNPTRVPIEKKESVRWLQSLQQSTEHFQQPKKCVHIADREADIFELFSAARAAGTKFLVRTCVDRCITEATSHVVSKELRMTRVKGHHWIEVRDKHGHITPALLEIKYRRLT
ncbi:MAG: hypothetical protein PHV34_22690 [Verrucomicrobiae bacterium]|nr:hypothetical protein [Verrucomicrobiae bacterium]